MVKVKKLTRENVAEELSKIAPAANRLYELQQKAKKKRVEKYEELVLRTLRDLDFMAKRLAEQQEQQDRIEKQNDGILRNFRREREERSAKIKAGLARAKKRGVKLGGARRTSGVDARSVVALRRRGMTQEEIAKVLKISQPLVSKILRRAS